MAQSNSVHQPNQFGLQTIQRASATTIAFLRRSKIQRDAAKLFFFLASHPAFATYREPLWLLSLHETIASNLKMPQPEVEPEADASRMCFHNAESQTYLLAGMHLAAAGSGT